MSASPLLSIINSKPTPLEDRYYKPDEHEAVKSTVFNRVKRKHVTKNADAVKPPRNAPYYEIPVMESKYARNKELSELFTTNYAVRYKRGVSKKTIHDYLKKNPMQSYAQMCEHFNVTRDVMYNNIRTMVEDGQLIRHGTIRSALFAVNPENTSRIPSRRYLTFTDDPAKKTVEFATLLKKAIDENKEDKAWLWQLSTAHTSGEKWASVKIWVRAGFLIPHVMKAEDEYTKPAQTLLFTLTRQGKTFINKTYSRTLYSKQLEPMTRLSTQRADEMALATCINAHNRDPRLIQCDLWPESGLSRNAFYMRFALLVKKGYLVKTGTRPRPDGKYSIQDASVYEFTPLGIDKIVNNNP